MTTKRQLQELINLIRLRYPHWDSFAHPTFTADEINYKQATIQKAQQWLNQTELDNLLEIGNFQEIKQRLEKLSRDNNLLWRSVPSAGDTAVLHYPHLDLPTFCTQIRNLLYADPPTPQRLQNFADYLTHHQLPNKWPLPTYLLFICHPQQEIFIKPRTMTWFLKFVGLPQSITSPPDGETYHTIQTLAHNLKSQLAPYQAQDMVDIQSFIWVCAREAKKTHWSTK